MLPGGSRFLNITATEKQGSGWTFQTGGASRAPDTADAGLLAASMGGLMMVAVTGFS